MLRSTTIAIAALFPLAVHAQCPGDYITATEGGTWQVEIDLKPNSWESYLPSGQRKTASVFVECKGSAGSIRQYKASDNNNCTYLLNVNGSHVYGPYTCSSIAESWTFDGNFH